MDWFFDFMLDGFDVFAFYPAKTKMRTCACLFEEICETEVLPGTVKLSTSNSMLPKDLIFGSVIILHALLSILLRA